MSFPFHNLEEELALIVQQATSLLWESDKEKAEETLQNLAPWLNTDAEKNWVFLLVRGKALYFCEQDDEARETLLAILRLENIDPDGQVFALCSLAAIEHYHNNTQLEEEYILQAKSIGSSLSQDRLSIAELEYQYANWLLHTKKDLEKSEAFLPY